MSERRLGHSGVKVSPICLGAMMFGGQTDEGVAARILGKARERGINFIDTANVYAEGRSEEVVGRLIGQDRQAWVLASKFGYPNPGGSGSNQRGASRRNLYQSVEASLRRLNTDYLDLLYLHLEDGDTLVQETVRAIGDLISSGKVRYFGLSNHRGYRIAEFAHVADALGVDRPVASQPLYNIANRQAEVEQLPAAAHYGLGVVSYSPLARGILTGKYAPGAAPVADTRAGRNDKRIQQTEWRPESLQLAQRIAEHARERGITPGQFALAWVINNQLVTSAIAGPRTEAQWDEYLPALDYQLTQEDEALVNDLVTTGHPSTPGFNDPAYPVTGRVPRTR